jgi:ubiquitin carboxyl-terminal hydrolase L5
MAEYEEDQIEFSILSLVQDPIVEHIGELALNVKRLIKLKELLTGNQDVIQVAGQHGANLDDIMSGPALAFGLTQEDIDLAKIPDEQEERYRTYSLERLALEQRNLCASQHAIKASIQEELQSRQRDDDYAAGRRHDYTPAVYSWARILARKGVIRDLVSES